MTITPFEASGHTEWTTLEEEEDLYQVLNATGRLTVEVLGPASPPRDSRLVRRVTVDLPNTPHDAPSVLFVGLQHGNEPVGREILLSTIRDLAETTDPAMLDLLSRCRFHFIPTANPSAFPDWRAVYGQGGANMNREHLSLALAESQYMQQTITDLDPVAVLDFHEHFAPVDNRFRIEFLPGEHPMGDSPVDALSSELMTAIQERLDSDDIEHGLYSPASTNVYVLRGATSIQGRMFLLVETPARENIISPQTRFQWYTIARDEILGWFAEHIEEASTTVAEGKVRQAFRTDPFDLTNGQVLDPPPAAYTFPAPPPHHFEVFGLGYTEADGIVTVHMEQPGRAMIPYLLDPDAPDPIVPAVRVAAPPLPPLDPADAHPPLDLADALAMRVQLNGHTYDALQIRTIFNGRIVKVWP